MAKSEQPELTSSQLVKDMTAFLDRFNKDNKYQPRVKDRKELQHLYGAYSTVSNDDNSLLKEVKEVERLMGEINKKMQV